MDKGWRIWEFALTSRVFQMQKRFLDYFSCLPIVRTRRLLDDSKKRAGLYLEDSLAFLPILRCCKIRLTPLDDDPSLAYLPAWKL